MACFADINVSQGSVATHVRCGGIFNINLTTNLSTNLPVFFLNRLRFDRIVVTSLWPQFFGPPCSTCNVKTNMALVVSLMTDAGEERHGVDSRSTFDKI